MKICFVTNLRLPNERGVSYGVVIMCRALALAGVTVELVAPKCRPVPEIRGDIWEYHQIKTDTFRLTRLPHIWLPEVFGAEKIISHLRYLVGVWSFSLLAFFYLVRAGAEYIHLFNDAKELLFLLKLVGWWFRPKIVYEVHMLPVGLYDRAMEWLAVSRADLVLVTTKKFAAHYGLRSLVFPNGVDLAEFDYKTPKPSLRRELKLPIDAFIVGYSGRFTTMGMEKGIPELIAATARLIEKYPKLVLVCVGGTADQVLHYRRDARKSGLTGKQAIFVGDVPRKTLYRYMRTFNVCAMPFPNLPHFADNMSPLKMFEYMASKNPIVATNLPSIRETLHDGANAVLAEPGDVNNLGQAIERLIKDQAFGRKISARAYTEVSERFTWQKRAEAVISRLEQLK